jgi:branched-chain amino acid aminotransferase
VVSQQELTFSNLRRGFLYGETVFTSFSTADHSFLYLEQHLDRLFRGADYLFGQEREASSLKWKIIREMVAIKEEQSEHNLRFRITLFLDCGDSESLLPPASGCLSHLVTWSTHPSLFDPSPALTMFLSKQIRYPTIYPYDLKLGNYAGAIFEQKIAKRKGRDDLLFMNHRGGVAECSTSNIFFILDSKVYTPAVTPDIFPGILRRELINFMSDFGYEVVEEELSCSILKHAQEAFSTNMVRGISPVVQIGTYSHYQYAETLKLFERWVRYCRQSPCLTRLSDLSG